MKKCVNDKMQEITIWDLIILFIKKKEKIKTWCTQRESSRGTKEKPPWKLVEKWTEEKAAAMFALS